VCYVVGLSSPSEVKKFLFFLSRRGERGRVFAVFFAPFPEKGILDFIAHRPIIQVFTVWWLATLLEAKSPWRLIVLGLANE